MKIAVAGTEYIGLINGILLVLQNNKSSYKDLITFVEDRAGYVRRYAIDTTKLKTELGWKANENFKSGILITLEYYVGKY